MAGEAQTVADWWDEVFGGISGVQAGGVAMPSEPTINFVGFTVTDDPTNARTTVVASGGGGGGFTPYGSTLLTSVTFTRPTGGNLQVSADSRQDNAAINAQAWASAQVNDQIDLSDDAYYTQTKALTFDGNGIPVVEPDVQTSPPDFSNTRYSYRFAGEHHIWRLVQVPSLNSGNPFWRAVL